MDQKVATISRNSNGNVKLEYYENDRLRSALWEPFSTGILNTIFDEDGAVLRQEMLPKKNDTQKEMDAHISEFMKSANVKNATDSSYNEIKLQKKCPTCGSSSISRYIELNGEKPVVPILPTYLCAGCKGRCYYLSDTYLDYLVSNNNDLFSKEELKELESNKDAFLSELKEYIIRIFASKRIMRIK
ncbi:MAG: hypothetical protein ACHQX1_03255 [Candidatus Micrarchaeales archaeon]